MNVNVPERTFVHNFERTVPERSVPLILNLYKEIQLYCFIRQTDPWYAAVGPPAQWTCVNKPKKPISQHTWSALSVKWQSSAANKQTRSASFHPESVHFHVIKLKACCHAHRAACQAAPLIGHGHLQRRCQHLMPTPAPWHTGTDQGHSVPQFHNTPCEHTHTHSWLQERTALSLDRRQVPLREL